MEFENQVNNQFNNQVVNEMNLINTIPLENINVIGYMVDNLGKINYEMTFYNSTNEVINPIYYFSLDTKATICKFTMMIGTKVLMAEVQEKKKAQKTYTQAQSEGKKTALIEKISDIDYKVSVGNVEPGLRVIISFDYLIVLELDEESKYKFNIPTNIGIKYFFDHKIQKDWEYQQELNKIKWTDNTDDIKYFFDFELRWISSTNFIEFTSNIDNIDNIEIKKDKFFIFRGTQLPFEGDINLNLKTELNLSGYIYDDLDSQKTFILSNIKIPDKIVSNNSQKNYQFILDRSGSMSGSRIINAIKALEIFIDELPTNSYFNVISFGSNYSAIWSNSVQSSSNHKNKCIDDIKSYRADMGGTQLYDCLQDILVQSQSLNNNNDSGLKYYKYKNQKTCSYTCENILILLTDGEVGSINSIFNMINEQKLLSDYNTRIFTFGLGNGASKQLIKGLSDLTFGDYTMIDDNEDLIQPIKKIIKTANKEYYTKIKVELEDNSKNMDIKLNNIESIYPGKIYSIIYDTELNDIDNIKKYKLKISGFNSKKQKNEWKINLDKIYDEEFNYSIIKQLYYNEYIKKLQKSIEFDNISYDIKNDLINKIIKISVENNIMNEYTSFVLVDYSSEFDITQIGKDIVIPQLSRTKSNYSTNIYNQDNIINYEDEVDCLEGGMDMFGGGCGRWEQKYPTFVILENLDKIKNPINGSYKFEADGWKHLCYISQKDFDTHCKKVGMVRVLFFNFIILLELKKYPNKTDSAKKLFEYFELKYPGLFNSKKYEISKLYYDYIEYVKTIKVYIECDCDY